MAWWAGMAAQGGAQLGKLDDALTGMAIGKYGDRRQYFQQKKLQELAIRGQKELADYNQQLSMDMWDKTNAEAQRKHLERAGLNVGLMYGSTPGSGGSTQGGSAGGISTAMATGGSPEIGMAMQTGTARRMQAAQIALTEAEANKTNIEAKKLEGVDTTKVGQETANLEVQNAILKHEEEIKAIAARVQGDTEADQLEAIRNANDKSEGEAKSALARGEIDQATQDSLIEQIRTATIEQQLRIAAQKAGIENVKTQTESTKKGIQEIAKRIQNMSAQQRMEWMKYDQQEKERWVKEAQLELNKQGIEFHTGNAAQAKQWTDVISQIMNTIPAGGGRKIGF